MLALAAGVELVVGRISAIRREQDIFILDFAGAGVTSLSASLVVDATGRAAALACRLGIERIVKERLVAERRTIDRSDLPQGNAVWLDVEAHRDSWNYETYGPDGRRENWTISRDGRRCGASADVANASSTCLAQAAGPGWIAIGDAAAAFDPIASQGLFNALSAAMVAAGIIAERGAVSFDVAADYTAAMISTFLHSERGRTQVYAARSKATSNSESIPNGLSVWREGIHIPEAYDAKEKSLHGVNRVESKNKSADRGVDRSSETDRQIKRAHPPQNES
ncbi:NAD(P)/FAD-dependent oxidoreductase [Sinorhizobium psoraleae]|uniref:NAD(P)/FAD-dependent oxidoreductase n=1 Tax=Sinorhizobium psoraleae TaxID=520838 RepID=UPI0028A172C1|nr:hypothetical protein [Sinorhizobium psoraleae]